MIITIKDCLKLLGISVVICCAVFISTLFLNYNIDIASIENDIPTPVAAAMYDSHMLSGKLVAAVSGGCLCITSVVLLFFYIKNYIDIHSSDLGILKALGYSSLSISMRFWVFGLSVLFGAVIGFAAATLYMPKFYEIQNADGLLPELSANLHPILIVWLIVVPTIAFALLSIIYSLFKLKKPALSLLKEAPSKKIKASKAKSKERPFLKELASSTHKSKKTYVFLVAFAAFCFSAMLQMSGSMEDLASKEMAVITLGIGLILAFMCLLLSLSSVVKGNAKTIAMMRVFGYDYRSCSRAVIGSYRPFAYLGFAVGSVYQYVLLKIAVDVVFAGIEGVPEYNFDVKSFIIALVLFAIGYELFTAWFSSKIKKQSIKSVMLE